MMNIMNKDKKARKKVTKVKIGITKKEIRNKIQDSVNQAIADLHIGSPSKKTKKAVKKTSGKLAGKIRKELKNKKPAKNPETAVVSKVGPKGKA
jgi:hypothetical protein